MYIIILVISLLASPYFLEGYFISKYRDTWENKFLWASILFGVVCIAWSFVFLPIMYMFIFGTG